MSAFSDLLEGEPAERKTRVRVPRVLRSDQISTRPKPMLVRGWIPSAAITLLAGMPGAGKGVVLADVISRGSRGDLMPNGDRLAGRFSSWIVCGAGEDGDSDWKSRLVAAGADPAFYRIVPHVLDDLGYESAICAADLSTILNMAAADGARLVVIDSLGAVAGNINLDRTEVRDQLMNPLANQAHALGLAVVIVHHVRKSGGDVLTMVANSVQIVAAARSVLTIVTEKGNEEGTRFLAVSKLNGSRKSAPVAFTTSGVPVTDDNGTTIVDDRGDTVFVPVVQWSDRKVSDAEVDAAANNLPNVDQADGLADHLRDLLAAGPVRSTELEADLQQGGYSKDQIRRRCLSIGAGKVKIGSGERAGWWTLPPGMPKAEGRQAIEQGGSS